MCPAANESARRAAPRRRRPNRGKDFRIAFLKSQEAAGHVVDYIKSGKIAIVFNTRSGGNRSTMTARSARTQRCTALGRRSTSGRPRFRSGRGEEGAGARGRPDRQHPCAHLEQRSGRPRVHELEAQVLEMPDVTGGQRRPASQCDAGDLNIANLDRTPRAALLRGDHACRLGGVLIEG